MSGASFMLTLACPKVPWFWSLEFHELQEGKGPQYGYATNRESGHEGIQGDVGESVGRAMTRPRPKADERQLYSGPEIRNEAGALTSLHRSLIELLETRILGSMLQEGAAALIEIR
jgi:hypothetical protein